MMKKFLLIVSIFVLPVLFVQLVSCSKTPTSPIITVGGSSNTSTFTPVPSGPTNTPTQTLVPGAPTYTPTLSPTITPTFGLTPTPVYENNYGTVAAPNGFYYAAGVLWVAEGEIKVGGDVSAYIGYTLAGNALSSFGGSNEVVTGFPTPQATPAWAGGTTIILAIPQGIAYTPANGGYFALLDSPPSGSASMYEGCTGFNINSIPLGSSQYTNYGVGYEGSPFNAPKALASDSIGDFYIADTGNGYVEQFGEVCSSGPPPALNEIHRWYGYTPNGTFKQPYAVACDSSNNVYVGDAGYNPSIIEEFKSDGTTIQNGYPFNTVAGCVVHGLALDSSVSPANIYVADAGNDLIEEYSGGAVAPVGTLLREWGDPHGPHEIAPFIPSCIAITGTNIIVGDVGNDELQVFGP